MRVKKKLIFGVGINDVDYVVQPTIRGFQTICPFYDCWTRMLERCYSDKFHIKNKTYIGCSVVEDWIYLSKFKAWMETQDWEGKHLDKDLLFPENKQYGPDTCVFINPDLNKFINSNLAMRGKWPLGVDLHKATGKFRARCCNPFNLENEHLGLFTCPYEAHNTWKTRKHELACLYADMQEDIRIADALKTRYL